MEGDDYYIDGDMVEDEITKQKRMKYCYHDNLCRRILEYKEALSPVPPEDDKAKAVSAADNIVEIEKEGTGDVAVMVVSEITYCCQ